MSDGFRPSVSIPQASVFGRNQCGEPFWPGRPPNSLATASGGGNTQNSHGKLQSARFHAFLPVISGKNLLIVTAMSFDSAMVINQNGTVLCGGSRLRPLSRHGLSPALMMDKSRADNNGSKPARMKCAVR